MTSRILLCCLNSIFAVVRVILSRLSMCCLLNLFYTLQTPRKKVRYVYLLQLNNEIGSLDLVYTKRGRLHTLAYYKIRTGLKRDMQLCTAIYIH